MPLIREHISVAEWEKFGEEAFAKFANPEKPIATGVLLEVATPAEASSFLDPLPIRIRLMWWLHGQRKYAAYIRRVRGARNHELLMRRLGPTANRLGATLYRRSRGKVGGTAKGVPVMLVTVPGRRTGTPRTTPRRLLRRRRQVRRRRDRRWQRRRAAVVPQPACDRHSARGDRRSDAERCSRRPDP